MEKLAILVTLKSRNAKTGPIPVTTTSAHSCPSVCPATYRDDISCATCGLCQRANRKVIVGFPAHGSRNKVASAIAMS